MHGDESKNLKGIDQLENMGGDVRIIFKSILRKRT
jgi:hypothetical protein